MEYNLIYGGSIYTMIGKEFLNKWPRIWWECIVRSPNHNADHCLVYLVFEWILYNLVIAMIPILATYLLYKFKIINDSSYWRVTVFSSYIAYFLTYIPCAIYSMGDKMTVLWAPTIKVIAWVETLILLLFYIFYNISTGISTPVNAYVYRIALGLLLFSMAIAWNLEKNSLVEKANERYDDYRKRQLSQTRKDVADIGDQLRERHEG